MHAYEKHMRDGTCADGAFGETTAAEASGDPTETKESLTGWGEGGYLTGSLSHK